MTLNEDIEKKIKKLTYLAKDNNKKAIIQILEILKPLRLSLGRKFGNKGIEFDDLISQIDLLIIESAMNYDEQKDPSALRHIISRTRNGIWNYYRKEMNYFKNNKSNILFDPMELEKKVRDSFVEDENNMINKIVLSSAIDKLTKKQKNAILKYYFEGFVDSEIAKDLNIDQSNATRARHRGLLALIKILE